MLSFKDLVQSLADFTGLCFIHHLLCISSRDLDPVADRTTLKSQERIGHYTFKFPQVRDQFSPKITKTSPSTHCLEQ